MTKAADQDERVRLLAKLGAGGMADVFLGLQLGEHDFSRFVVVKKIHARHIDDDQALGMFFDEARTIAQLNHPHIVKIFDLQRLAQEVCLTMEYVDGEALSYVMTRLRSGGRHFPPAVVCKLILDALDALQYAHEARHNDGTPLELVHRDISPQNLMLDQNGYVKVIDFGIAKTTIQTELTSPGGIKGKVTYLAPESFTERNIDRRVDVYALGIVLWECLTLRKALAIRDAPMQEVMDAVCHLELDPPSEHNDKITDAFDAVVARAVAVKRSERYGTCGEFAKDLREVALATVGIASASEVATWFQATFTSRLEKRKTFEQDALARMAEDDAQKSAAPDEESLPTAAALAGDAAPLAARTDQRLAEVVGPEETASKRGTVDGQGAETPATFVAGPQTMTAQMGPPRNPYVFLGFLFLLFVVGAFVVRLLFFGGSSSEPNVVIQSVPSGAEVFVGTHSEGRTTSTGLSLNLPVDEDTRLTFKREGYEDYVETVRPRADAVVTLAPILVAVRAKAPGAENGSEIADLPDGDDAGPLVVDASPKVDRSSRQGRRRTRARGRSVAKSDTPSAPAVPSSPETPAPKSTVSSDGAPNPSPPKSAGGQTKEPEAREATAIATAETKPAPEDKPATKNSSTNTPTTNNPAPPKTVTPAPSAPTDEKKFYSKSGQWSGPTVIARGCGRCHNAKKAPRLNLKKKTKRQWQRFFSRDQHNRHGKLDNVLSAGEQKRALATILQRIEDDSTFGLAGDR